MIQENYQDLRNEMKSYFVGTTWGLPSDFFLYDGKESDAKQIFLKTKQRFFNSQFFGIKGFSKNKITTSRRVLLEDLITVFKQKNAVSQVSVDGFCKTSFSYIDKMRNDKETGKTKKELMGSVTMDRIDSADISEFGMLVKSNIVQLRKIKSCAEKSTKNKYSYTTFEFRINPEYIPFVDALNSEIWADLSCWQNNEVEMVDLANSLHQAKQAEKQAQTSEIRAKLEDICKSPTTKLFESLLLKSEQEQVDYFVNLEKSLGKSVSHKNHREIVDLGLAFVKFKNKKYNVFEQLYENYRKQRQQARPDTGSEQRTELGFMVQANQEQTATAATQQSAPSFTNTKEMDREIAKEEFRFKPRIHDVSEESSDKRVQDMLKFVVKSKQVVDDQTIKKPKPSRNNERPASIDLKAELEKDRINRQQQQTKQINRHNNIFNELQQEVIKTLIKTSNPNTLYEQELTMLQKLDILELTENYSKQLDIDYNKFQNSEWIWNIRT